MRASPRRRAHGGRAGPIAGSVANARQRRDVRRRTSGPAPPTLSRSLMREARRCERRSISVRSVSACATRFRSSRPSPPRRSSRVSATSRTRNSPRPLNRPESSAWSSAAWPRRSRRAAGRELRDREPRVGRDASLGARAEPCTDALGRPRLRTTHPARAEVSSSPIGHVDHQAEVEAVDQRAGHPAAVAVDHGLGALAAQRARVPARTGVHRADEQERRRHASRRRALG